MQNNGIFYNLVERFSSLIFFIIGVILILVFRGVSSNIKGSLFYFGSNCVIFTLMMIFFIIYTIIFLKSRVKKTKIIDEFKSINFLFLLIVILISLFVVFIMFKEVSTGRFRMSFDYLGNVFIKEYFIRTPAINLRSYSMVFYSILQTIFHVKVTPLIVLTVNKIISIFLLAVIFLISKKIFKNNFIGLLIWISFISSIWVQYNFGTIEYAVGSAFFVYTSILFLFIFHKTKNFTAFILSNICIILAAYYKYELSFLFGLPYLVYYCIFIKKNNRTRKCILITSIILLFLLISLIVNELYNSDISPEINSDKQGIFSLLKIPVDIMKYNVLIKKDLALQLRWASLFTYFCAVTSLILIINTLYNLIRTKNMISKYNIIYLFAFYFMFYFIFLLAFHTAAVGLRSSMRYSLNYILSEFILTYFAIGYIIEKIFLNKSRNFINTIKIISMVLFFIIAIEVSPSLSLSSKIHPFFISDEVAEIKFLKENADVDESCKIIKVYHAQPILDYYLGLQENSVFFGAPPIFYESIREYKKEGKCFYYYDEKLDSSGPLYYRIKTKRLDNLFSNCNKSVFEIPIRVKYQERVEYKYEVIEITRELIKYDC